MGAKKRMNIIPTGYHVLVLPDTIEELAGFKEEGDGYVSDGGIWMHKETEAIKDIQRERAAQVVGTLAAVGPSAWRSYDYDIPGYDWRPWAEVGDKVVFAKYGGKYVTDPASGIDYVLLNDNDITAIVKEEENEDNGE